MSIVDTLVKRLLTSDRLSRLNLREETQEDRDNQLPLIEFFIEPEWRGVFPEPELALKNIATWWKKVPQDLKPEDFPNGRFTHDHLGAPMMSAKRCIPLFDGMTLGYTLFTAVDIALRTDQAGKFIEIHPNARYNGASTHDAVQLGGKTSPTYPGPAIKFHNPWVIKTRPGWSTLFIPPLNHADEKRFLCLGAMVDTDVYQKQVNFPGIWLERGFDGVIPAGTPLVTAIPYRRKDIQRDILIRNMTKMERDNIARMTMVQETRAHMYTGEMREDRRKIGTPKEDGCPAHERLGLIPAQKE